MVAEGHVNVRTVKDAWGASVVLVFQLVMRTVAHALSGKSVIKVNVAPPITMETAMITVGNWVVVWNLAVVVGILP